MCFAFQMRACTGRFGLKTRAGWEFDWVPIVDEHHDAQNGSTSWLGQPILEAHNLIDSLSLLRELLVGKRGIIIHSNTCTGKGACA